MCNRLPRALQLNAACSDLPGIQPVIASGMCNWPKVLAMVLHQLMAASGWVAGDAGQQVPPNTPGMPHRPAAGGSGRRQRPQHQHHVVASGVGAALAGAASQAAAGREGPQASGEPTPTPMPVQAAAGPVQQQGPDTRRTRAPARPATAAAAARRQATQRVLVYALSQWSPLLLKACQQSKQCPQWPPQEPRIGDPDSIVAVLLQAVPAVAASLHRATAAAAAATPAPPASDPQASSTISSAISGSGDAEDGADCSSTAGAGVSASTIEGENSSEGAARAAVPTQGAPAAGDAASWRMLLLHGMQAFRLMEHQLSSLPQDSTSDAAAAHFGRLYEPLTRALLGLAMAAPADLVPYMAAPRLLEVLDELTNRLAPGVAVGASCGGISPSAIGNLRVVRYAEQHPETVSRGSRSALWLCVVRRASGCVRHAAVCTVCTLMHLLSRGIHRDCRD